MGTFEDDAGCVTVVAAADAEGVATAFGCDALPDTPKTYADMTGEVDFDLLFMQAWFGEADGAAVVLEDNGFEGARPEVLRVASRASNTGVAASILWNTNGLVIFTAARRGKIVCSVELMDCEPDDLPRSLRQLAARAVDEGTDLVALGGAMVEKFTGVAFDDRLVPTAVHRTLTPVLPDLETDGPEGSALRHYAPDVVEAIAVAPPSQQRRLANWAARVAAVEAGVAGEAGVRALLDKNAWEEAPTLPPQLAGLLARWERDRQRWGNEHEDYVVNQSTDALEGVFLKQKVWAGRALMASTHPDPMEAALQVTYATIWTVGSTKRARGGKFVKNDNGRHRVYDRVSDRPRLGPRSRGFADLALEALADERVDWPALTARVPIPLTDSERQDAVRQDQERQTRGAFTTYVFDRTHQR